jgi:segregation and condensation protein B
MTDTIRDEERPGTEVEIAEEHPAGEEEGSAASPEESGSGAADRDVAEEESVSPAAEVAAAPLGRTLEAVLFASEIPLPAKRLAELSRVARRDVLEAIDALNVFYGETDRAFRIASIAGGYQLVTTPDHAALLGRLHKEKVPTRLSRAALETLAIIAFKQPVTRAEVDAIRGVSASDRVLRHLMERKLVRLAGRAEAPGRPLLYATTREFLAYFGLSSVKDLPRTDELAALLAGESPDRGELDEEIQEALGPEVAEALEKELQGEESAESGPEGAPGEGAEGPGEATEAADPSLQEALSEAEEEGERPRKLPAQGMMESGDEPEAPREPQSHSGEESDDEDEGTPAPQ